MDARIVLAEWQRRVVEAHPGPLLRGLFHSANASADLRELCCWALDQLIGPKS